MKTIRNTIITLIVAVMAVVIIAQHCAIKAPSTSVSSQTHQIEADAINPVWDELGLEDLLNAIEQVESGGDSNAVGDGGAAIGSFQIHKIYVDDVNRILIIWRDKLNEIFANYHTLHPDPNNIKSFDFEPYTYEDRYNKKHSRFMVFVYLTYYTPFNDNYDIDIEKAARIHNGGPAGYKKESTKPYWQKVKRELEGR